MGMRERPRDFWARRAAFRGIFKVEAMIFLASLFGAASSIPARQYWAGALFAALVLTTACLLWSHAGTRYGDAYDYGWEQGTAEALRDAEERRSAATQPCEILAPTAGSLAGHGRLYALKFSTGVIKVGQTQDLRRRLGEHRRDAEAFGAVIVDYWFSLPHQNYLENEVELIVMCDEVATWRSKREYFQGVEFAEVEGFASKLTYYSDSATPAEEVNA